MDEMTKLREWREDAPTPDRGRLAPGRRRLLDAAGRRRRRLPVLGDWRVAAGAVAVGVTAVALLSTTLGGDPGGGEGTPAARGGGQVTTATPAPEAPVTQDAPELLRLAAAEVADDPVPRPEVGEWVYTHSMEVNMTDTADPMRIEASWEKYADPEIENWNEGDDHSPRERFEYLAELPEEPEQVLQKARWFYPEDGGRPDTPNPGAGQSPQERASWDFGSLRMLLASAPMHPGGQARIYEAMATIPGVQVLDHTVEDAWGRSALSFHLDARIKGSTDDLGMRVEVLLDPVTYAYLGFRRVAVADSDGTNAPEWEKGDTVMASAVFKTALVDRYGVRP